MEGPTLRDDDMQGVIPRMVDKLFSSIAEKDENIVFTISVSYFEVTLNYSIVSLLIGYLGLLRANS